ncbi:MAG TPA: endolytic transglycosylase MltG [Pyrinomonadaceae bacterium]|nr:endolytic transglycosylase MltG [Pyrinomonadaceae bacterium]
MRRIISGITLTIILVLVAAGGWVYYDLRRPLAHGKSEQYIEIPRGSSPAAVVRKLTAEGILRHSWTLMVYLKLTGGGSRLRAGEYRFASPISPLGVYAKLRQGERRLSRITVIEGWTRWDIAGELAEIKELEVSSEEEVLKLMDDVSSISDLDPAARNLEGYLYPDTYEFSPDNTAAEVIQMMVKHFRSVWKPEWNEQARARNLTPRQIVTIASLIETEAKLPEERRLIASVIYNRLARDMSLGVDSTVVYASKLEGKWRDDGKVYRSDVERRSPYNTRLISGLPPGPIASPGRSSLEAALNPADSDYLYYVREPSRDDGAHNFYNNEGDFARGVQALREWERKREDED